MQISVTCPQCQSTYQLDPSMRGKRMRCKNPICQAVFEVKADDDLAASTKSSPTAPSPAAVGRVHSLQTGTVGAILPVLPAIEEELAPSTAPPGPAPATLTPAQSAPSAAPSTALVPTPIDERTATPGEVPSPAEAPEDFEF